MAHDDPTAPHTAPVFPPAAAEYAPEYQGYVDEAGKGDVRVLLGEQREEVLRVFGAVPADRAGHRYAPGKWSIRELLGHLIDADRVFGYRALTFARGATTPLPGFDEQVFMAHSGFNERSLLELVREF